MLRRKREKAERLIWINRRRVPGLHTRIKQILSRGIDMNTTKPEVTLYDRIGGAEAVSAMVGSFYEKVIADPDLKPYFDHVAMDKLRRMQTEFFSAALDGPVTYTGRPVIHAHQGQHITRKHFQAFVEHLFETLANY